MVLVIISLFSLVILLRGCFPLEADLWRMLEEMEGGRGPGVGRSNQYFGFADHFLTHDN